MKPETRTAIERAWSARPAGVREEPASEEELQAFEAKFGVIPDEFRWFLTACGGGAVGAEWVDSIEELAASHEKLGRESSTPRGWQMPGVFVIGWDGSGNPFGIQVDTNEVVVADHTYGGTHVMAPSFEKFLTRAILKNEPTDSN